MMTRDDYLRKVLDERVEKLRQGLITGFSLQEAIEEADIRFCGDYQKEKER